ncbi:hypothetical protein GCM10022267_85160 [Lentzea roselyniae]|uniref:Uncharacterized protein n=1 Tax=Lentzea roselyniae TaxID=531940 RepID=A0ABP7CEH4_9PSEU
MRLHELVVITRSASPETITAALRGAVVSDEELALMDELEFVDSFEDWREHREEL